MWWKGEQLRSKYTEEKNPTKKGIEVGPKHQWGQKV